MRETLANGGVDLELPTFFAVLGVMVYLPKEVVDAIFRVVASFPKDSQMVFTFSQGQSSAGLSAMAKEAAAVGDPFRTFHDPDTLCRDLLRIGYSRVAILKPQEAAELYYSGPELHCLRPVAQPSLVPMYDRDSPTPSAQRTRCMGGGKPGGVSGKRQIVRCGLQPVRHLRSHRHLGVSMTHRFPWRGISRLSTAT